MLKDRVWSTCTFWIWEDKHPIPMLYCFTGSIQQVFIVWTLFTSSTIDTRFTLYKMKFAIVDNQLQLLNKTGTLQIMQLQTGAMVPDPIAPN